MTPFLWTMIFLAMLFAGMACRFYLSSRQQRAVAGHRGALPPAFAEKITLASHQKAADYTLAKQRFLTVETVFDAIVLLLWTIGGGVAWLTQVTEPLPVFWRDVILVMLVFGIGSVLSLPLSCYQTFSIEARFGFNKTTRGLWVLDSFKALAVGLVIGVPLLMLLLWLVNEAGRYWWLWAWASMMLFQWVMLVIYPTIIAPIFNKFTPMPESETKSAILALLSRCGFTSNGLFVMDGSKRTSHGNAYFTGLGNAKRIVFFDTLLNRLKQDELLAVLAHELGHFKNNHIKKRMIFSAIGSLIVFALLAALMNAPWFYEGLGFSPDETDSAMTRPATALVLFMLALPVFSFFLTPIASWYSRRHEFEADHYGASQTSKDALIRALVCLYEDNAATVTPDALYSMFYDSHPSAPLRIAHLSSLNPATP